MEIVQVIVRVEDSFEQSLLDVKVDKATIQGRANMAKHMTDYQGVVNQLTNMGMALDGETKHFSFLALYPIAMRRWLCHLATRLQMANLS